MVPTAGMPKRRSASAFEVTGQPPMQAAREPYSAPAKLWARRAPNSMTARPCALRAMRFALVAMSDWWLMVASSIVSSSCVCGAGPRTTTSGSPGKIGVPSGTAQTSQVNLKSRR